MTEAITQRSRGMQDLLPDEMERLRAIEDAFRSMCRAWGYREVRTPTIEPLHLFTSAGTLSPQTLDRVYSFLDWDGWSGERVVLRPDSTIPVARLYDEHLDGGRVAKLSYSQNVFRFTEDGSSREEWQCGVELIGDIGLAGDIELVLLALQVLDAAGIGDRVVRLSHAGIVRAVLAAAGMNMQEQLVAYDRLLDGDMAVVEEVEARIPELNTPLRMLFEIEGEGRAYIENLRGPLTESIPALVPALDELASVVSALEDLDVRPRIRAALARSFEYYSGLILRIEADGRRIVAGGRYDELIGLVGDRPVPASGFALYVSPVVEMLRAPVPLSGPRVLVEPDPSVPAPVASIYETAARLRDAGLHVETIHGMHTTTEYRLISRADSPLFVLLQGGGSEPFDRLEDVIAVLVRAGSVS